MSKIKNIGSMFRVTQRMDIKPFNAFLYRIFAIILALITTGIFLFLLGYNPIEVYGTIINGSIGSITSLRETIKIATPLLLSALGVSIAFKMRFWNIGGEGQICVGAIVASYFAYFYSNLPSALLLIIMIVSGMIAAGLYGLIPAYFKTKYGTNETLFTLMLNYIAVYVIQYLREGPWRDPDSLGFPIMARFPKSARMPMVWGVHIGWIVALVLVAVIFIYVKYTKHGYELTVVGENKRTAEYAGMPVSKIIMRTMFISAAIGGLAGVFQASGADRQLTETVAGGAGFTAIIIAWLGRLSSPSILIISILFGILSKGCGTIETMLKIPAAMSDIIQGILLFFVLGADFFIRYQIKLSKNDKNREEIL